MFGSMYMAAPMSEEETRQRNAVLIAELRSAITQCAHIFGRPMTDRMIREINESPSVREIEE